MKIKCRPEDFQVDEQARLDLQGGSFALYRLTKRSLGTPEAIDRLLHRWQLSRQRVSYGGLKDRHAVTTQHLTIWQGPKRGLRDDQVQLEYLGQSAEAFTASRIEANRFAIIVRSLPPSRQAAVAAGLQSLRETGWPNYFDDQRFGSLGQSGEFVARPWCRGDWERALWLALADPNRHDRPRDRQAKQLAREHWLDWVQLKALLPKSSLRSTITYLVDHPTNFRGAFARLRKDLRSLYLAAYQSFLWNRWLSEIWTGIAGEDLQWLRSACGPLAWPVAGKTELAGLSNDLQLPLPSARVKLDGHPFHTALETVLEREGLDLRELRVKYPRDSFFSKGNRSMTVRPFNMQWEFAEDAIYQGALEIRLQFSLPRGSYATMGLKCLQSIDASEEDAKADDLENEPLEEIE
jgi:tRNA pseudouridine13 synthase